MRLSQLVETLDKQGRNEYVGFYRSNGKTFQIWLRINSPGHATVTYLKGYGPGTGLFTDVLPEFKRDLAAIGIVNIDYSTAIDDKTGGRARERLFKRYFR